MFLLLCCGVLFWVWREVEENSDPERSEARAVQRQAIVSLSSGNTRERLAAIDSLVGVRHDDDAVSLGPLSMALEDPEPSVRLAAAGVLGQMVCSVLRSSSGAEQVPSAVTALVRSARDDQPRIRSAAMACLGMIAASGWKVAADASFDRSAIIDVLVDSLDDPDADVRRAAIRALVAAERHLGVAPPQALARSLEDPVAENRLDAVQGLEDFRIGLDPWLLRVLRLASEDPDPSVRAVCLRQLSNMHYSPPAITPAVLPELIAGLEVRDPQLRSAVAGIIGHLGADGRPAIPELLRLLNDPTEPNSVDPPQMGDIAFADPGAVAAGSLGQIAPGTPEAGEVCKALIEAARSGPLARRASAVRVLSSFGPDAGDVIPVLIGFVTDRQLADTIRKDLKSVRTSEFENPGSAGVYLLAESVSSLGTLAAGTPLAERAVAALVLLLDFEESGVRFAAAQAIGRIGPEGAVAISHLRRRLTDEEPVVRSAAAESLSKLGPGASVAIPELRRLLKDPDGYVNFTVKQALERIERDREAAVPR